MFRNLPTSQFLLVGIGHLLISKNTTNSRVGTAQSICPVQQISMNGGGNTKCSTVQQIDPHESVQKDTHTADFPYAANTANLHSWCKR